MAHQRDHRRRILTERDAYFLAYDYTDLGRRRQTYHTWLWCMPRRLIGPPWSLPRPALAG